jgi:transcriptional regulator with XRE-family HTH domain
MSPKHSKIAISGQPSSVDSGEFTYDHGAKSLTSSPVGQQERQNSASLADADEKRTAAVSARLRMAVRAAGGNRAVAERSGIPLATVNNYVRGRHGMKIEPIAAMAAACGVTLDWLVTGDEAGPSHQPGFGPHSPPSGLSDSAGPSLLEPLPAEPPQELDLAVLIKAIEVVQALGQMPTFQDPASLARQIASTYAVLIKPPPPSK